MFKNRALDGSNNMCGKKIPLLRAKMGLSQREVADRLQIMGIDIDKNAVQRIESGERFVTDIELKALSALFNVSMEELTK